MKKSFKTFEEFIGDETTDSLKKKALEVQQKDGDKVYLDLDTNAPDPGDGEEEDDDSGDGMGSVD